MQPSPDASSEGGGALSPAQRIRRHSRERSETAGVALGRTQSLPSVTSVSKESCECDELQGTKTTDDIVAAQLLGLSPPTGPCAACNPGDFLSIIYGQPEEGSEGPTESPGRSPHRSPSTQSKSPQSPTSDPRESYASTNSELSSSASRNSSFARFAPFLPPIWLSSSTLVCTAGP
jgi:hypothetical protein